jgi:hypothetical protein
VRLLLIDALGMVGRLVAAAGPFNGDFGCGQLRKNRSERTMGSICPAAA